MTVGRGDPADRLAAQLVRRALGSPARLLADAHRPLAPLLTDLGAAIGPLLGAVGGRHADDLRALLDDERGLDRLVDRLDTANAGEEPDAEPR
jgi:hypothetical protein